MPSTRKPGLPTCWTASPITPSHGSISCCPGIGKAPIKQSPPDRQLTAVLVGCLPRGQAENLIKLHKAQLASDRTSCRCPLANQMRLILHTAGYWLMLTVRDAIPKAHALATAEFNTIRLRLLKLGARVVERFPASAWPLPLRARTPL